jgi:predicted Rossmann fold nucleotide-binding protein DprA/Smf involved in DNA uptake
MKTAVIGSRSFSHYGLVEQTLNGYALCLIISGGATGADTPAGRYAGEKGIPTLIFEPD